MDDQALCEERTAREACRPSVGRHVISSTIVKKDRLPLDLQHRVARSSVSDMATTTSEQITPNPENASANPARLITAEPSYTVPGLSTKEGATVAQLLQQRLNAYNDLHLTLKHVHWNVVGPHFISVHQMIDPQVETVRGYADEVAERIATLGSSPQGTPAAIVAQRDWNDYSIGRAGAIEHLAALDQVYIGVITSTREVAKEVEETDPVTNDLLIGHLHELEQFHWFVRAHLENAGGQLSTAGAHNEAAAAQRSARTDKV
jgi:starvation-inducible DNA-binding protein